MSGEPLRLRFGTNRSSAAPAAATFSSRRRLRTAGRRPFFGEIQKPLVFPRLHIAGVVLSGDFDVGVRSLAADIFQDLNGVLDMAFERNFAVAFGGAVENAADDRRAEDRGGLEHAPQLFFRCAL